GAWNGKCKQKGCQHPFPYCLKGPCDHGSHSVASEAEHHRYYGPAGQPDQFEQSVYKEGQPGEIAAVFQYREEEEKCGHNGENDTDRIPYPQCNNAIFSHEKLLNDLPRDQMFN